MKALSGLLLRGYILPDSQMSESCGLHVEHAAHSFGIKSNQCFANRIANCDVLLGESKGLSGRYKESKNGTVGEISGRSSSTDDTFTKLSVYRRLYSSIIVKNPFCSDD